MFVELSPEDLALPGQSGLLPLSCALKLGYQWEPVISQFVKEDPAVVETIQKQNISPFLAAATVTHGKNFVPSLGEYKTYQEYQMCNALNNTYKLLRLNPRMLEQICNDCSTTSEKRPLPTMPGNQTLSDKKAKTDA